MNHNFLDGISVAQNARGYGSKESGRTCKRPLAHLQSSRVSPFKSLLPRLVRIDGVVCHKPEQV